MKEVLFETPIFKPYQVLVLMAEIKTQMAIIQNPSKKFQKIMVSIEEVTEDVFQQVLGLLCLSKFGFSIYGTFEIDAD